MLTDPENPSESWEIEVWAKNLDTAHSLCEQVASQYLLTDVTTVSQATKTPTKNGEYKFICWFKTEVTNDSRNH